MQITLAEDIPANADEGRPLRFTVSQDLKMGDGVAIAKGAVVTGEIVDSAKKKFIGTSKMTLRLIDVAGVAGNKIKVRGTPSKPRDGQAVRNVDTGVRQKSKDVAASAGTEYIAYIDGDQTVPARK